MKTSSTPRMPRFSQYRLTGGPSNDMFTPWDVWARFPKFAKSAEVRGQVAGVHAHFKSSELNAHQMAPAGVIAHSSPHAGVIAHSSSSELRAHQISSR